MEQDQPRLEPGGILRALRHRNYRLFISGQLVSLIGTWMQSVAQAWLVYRLTGSSTLLGMVGFSGQIPVFLLAPIGGAVADRMNRHHVVIATQTTSMLLAFTMALLDLTGVIQVWHVFVVSALLGVTNAFDVPARQSFISQLVPREDLMNAIALNSSMFNSARILGPSIAGILISVAGEGWCFFGDGISYVAVLIALFMMRVEPRQPVHGRSAVADILEGFRFVLRTPPIHSLLALLGVVSMIGMPYTVLMPVFADRILHSGARGLGLLMAATGVGALLGALMLAAKREVKGLGNWVSIACACFGGSLILFTLSRNLLLSMVLLVPVGFA
ncbi:MAG: MFS transporter, partial [Acidobacteria bacterium]|nr:MFS transporter [Acidobacteriota bacterium]